jgi:hypothetical protein
MTHIHNSYLRPILVAWKAALSAAVIRLTGLAECLKLCGPEAEFRGGSLAPAKPGVECSSSAASGEGARSH